VGIANHDGSNSSNDHRSTAATSALSSLSLALFPLAILPLALLRLALAQRAPLARTPWRAVAYIWRRCGDRSRQLCLERFGVKIVLVRSVRVKNTRRK